MGGPVNPGRSCLFRPLLPPSSERAILVLMGTGLARFIQSIPVIDVHEHHMPEETPGRQIGLLQLLEESYAGWTQTRPNPLPSEPPVTLGSLSSSPGTWADIAVYVEGSGTNAAVRSMVRALCELYEVGAGEITEGNWEKLDSEIRRRNADPSWSAAVMDKAGIQTAISDPYRDPLLDVWKALGA